MLEQLLEQRDAVSLVLTSTPSVKNLSAQQWATVADLMTTLKPFLDVTKEMSGAAYPTLSMILPVLDGLRHMLRSCVGGLDVLRDLLVKYVDEKFANFMQDDELWVATVVDPRFKLLMFEASEQRQRAIDATVALMECASSTEIITAASAPAATASSSASTAPSSSSTPEPVTLWGKLNAAKAVQATASAATSQSTRQMLQQQLNAYLDEPALAHGESPLSWWAENKKQYPLVAAVARRLLAVPATSVASERLFSKAGNVITKKRNSLSGSKANSVIFCMENL